MPIAPAECVEVVAENPLRPSGIWNQRMPLDLGVGPRGHAALTRACLRCETLTHSFAVAVCAIVKAGSCWQRCWAVFRSLGFLGDLAAETAAYASGLKQVCFGRPRCCSSARTGSNVPPPAVVLAVGDLNHRPWLPWNTAYAAARSFLTAASCRCLASQNQSQAVTAAAQLCRLYTPAQLQMLLDTRAT